MNTPHARFSTAARRPLLAAWWHNLVFRFAVLTLGPALAITIGLWYVLHWNVLLAWFLTITLVTLATYRYDKAIAGSQHLRVPENVLHLLTLVGGTFGALTAMWLIRPRHKTLHGGFVLRFFIIAGLQLVVAFAVYWFWMKS